MSKLRIVLDGSLKSGAKMAQAVHAAQLFGKQFRDIEQKWMEESNTIVILEVSSLSELEMLVRKALSLGINLAQFKRTRLE